MFGMGATSSQKCKQDIHSIALLIPSKTVRFLELRYQPLKKCQVVIFFLGAWTGNFTNSAASMVNTHCGKQYRMLCILKNDDKRETKKIRSELGLWWKKSWKKSCLVKISEFPLLRIHLEMCDYPFLHLNCVYTKCWFQM